MKNYLSGEQNDVTRAAAEADLDVANKVYIKCASGLNTQRKYRKSGKPIFHNYSTVQVIDVVC